LKLSFLCIDSTGEHETGDPIEWQNIITLKYRIYDKGDNKVVVLQSAPATTIKYTTDGSNPKEYGGVYDGEIEVPSNATYVLAVAEANGIYSEPLQIKIDRTKASGLTIEKDKLLRLYKRYKTNDTAETYQELAFLKKHGAKLSDVIITLYKVADESGEKGWIELVFDSSVIVEIDRLENSIDIIRDNFITAGKVNISLEYGIARFASGQDFLDWVAAKRMLMNDFSEQEIVQ
jgi:hypothetical protein